MRINRVYLISAYGGFAARCLISRFAFPDSTHGLYQTQRNRQVLVPTKPHVSLSGTEQLKVRPIKTEKEFESVVINALVKEGWGPGLHDAECFMACDPTAGFAGELNGKPIGCITVAKYGDSFAFAGCYIVSKEYRGKKYGKEIYEAAFEIGKSFPSFGTISGLQQEKINQRYGFRSLFLWSILRL